MKLQRIRLPKRLTSLTDLQCNETWASLITSRNQMANLTGYVLLLLYRLHQNSLTILQDSWDAHFRSHSSPSLSALQERNSLLDEQMMNPDLDG